MNILFVNAKKAWAGVVSWSVSLSRELKKKNHNCYIVTGFNSSLNRNKPDDIELHTIKYGMNYNPFTILYFVKFIKKHKIDIIITNIKKEVIFGGLAGKFTGVPVIRRSGYEKDFYGCKFLETHFVDYELFPCKYSRNLALTKFNWLNKDRTEVIHTGKPVISFTNEEIEKKRKEWGVVNSDTIVIGISDRLNKDKGIDVLINAFAQLIEKYDNIKLVITGKESYEGILKKLVKNLGIQDQVHFAGFTTKIMLTASAYDIAVLASFYESFPNTLIEYMASNTAVVATEVGGVPELVKNNQNGFLIKKNNVEELVNSLDKFISDKDLRYRFAMNALETIKAGFSEEIMSDKTIEFFRRIKQ